MAAELEKRRMVRELKESKGDMQRALEASLRESGGEMRRGGPSRCEEDEDEELRFVMAISMAEAKVAPRADAQGSSGGDTEEALSTILAFTGCTAEQAHALLQATNGNVEMAVDDFFLPQEAGGSASGAQGGPVDDECDDGEQATLNAQGALEVGSLAGIRGSSSGADGSSGAAAGYGVGGSSVAGGSSGGRGSSGTTGIHDAGSSSSAHDGCGVATKTIATDGYETGAAAPSRGKGKARLEDTE